MVRISSGPWGESEISKFLRTALIPVRLASTGRQGPVVQSLWFTPELVTLRCCTQRSSWLARRLEADGQVGFEVAADLPPYRGVRGTGVASVSSHDVAAVLDALLDRYHAAASPSLASWLRSRIESEVVISIQPEVISSWDFTERMADGS